MKNRYKAYLDPYAKRNSLHQYLRSKMSQWKFKKEKKVFCQILGGSTVSVNFESTESQVSYLLNNLYQILQNFLSTPFVSDDRSSQIAQNVWTHGLDGVQVPDNNTLIV